MNKNITWVVQTNLIKEDLCVQIEYAATKLGHGYVGALIIPFSGEMDLDPPVGKLVPYGSTTLIKNFVNHPYWNKDGLFFDQENFRTSAWIKQLGARMLNHDAQILTLQEATKLNLGNKLFFMKPDNDLKDFTGSLVTLDGIEKFYQEVSAGGFMFDKTIPVVVSPLKNMGWEFRLFMIKDQVISASSYKLKEMLKQDKRVSDDVYEFARETANIWRPDDVYVMDVCESEQGYKVVEFNCFNASGFYACNVEKIVKSVSEYLGA